MLIRYNTLNLLRHTVCIIEDMERLTKRLWTASVAGLAFSFALSLNAAVYTFNPSDGNADPDDIWDLDHYKYFTWGVKNFSVPQNQVITKAVLTFSNINNWTAAENNGTNWLNVWLMDRALVQGNYVAGSGPDGSLKMYSDNQGIADAFATWQPSIAKTKIGVYTDYNGGPSGDVINLVYDFSPMLIGKLTTYIANGNNFALGFDPDCHYWNDGVRFEVTTSVISVPDQSMTLALMGLGLAGLIGFRRKFRS